MTVHDRWIKEAVQEQWDFVSNHYDIGMCPEITITDAVQRMGTAHYGRVNGEIVADEIRISRNHKNKAKCMDTILHEIAHFAATITHQEQCKHGPKWKRVARKIGAEPSACGDGDMVDQDAWDEKYKYAVACPDCGYVRPYQRRAKIYDEVSKENCRDNYTSGYYCPECEARNLIAGPMRQVKQQVGDKLKIPA